MPSFNYAKVGSESSRNSLREASDAYTETTLQTAWSKSLNVIPTIRWPLLLLLLSLVFACEVVILHKQPASSQVGSEINSLIPNFSIQEKIFREDTRYKSDHETLDSINATKQHWLDLMPRGDGFINIPSYATHTLPPPMHYPSLPNQDIYAIAVFHQLHCLHSISHFTDTLLLQLRRRDFSLDAAAIEHNDHCFNYLRNALMCCGDTTLEGQAQTPGFRDLPGTDGTGAMHVCRNYDEIVSWAVRHGIRAGDVGNHHQHH